MRLFWTDSSCSALNCLLRCSDFAEQIPLEVLPHGVVPHAVDDGADGARQDLHNDEAGKERVCLVLWEGLQDELVQLGGRVCGGAEQHLNCMQQNCVSGFLGTFARGFCSKQNLEVRVKDNDPNYNQIHIIGVVSLLDGERIWEGGFSDTKNSGMKKFQRLCGQGDEQIWKYGHQAGHPHQSNQPVCPFDRPDLGVAERHADGDVALRRHAGQVQRRVLAGEEGDQDQDATDGNAELFDGVADDEQGNGQNQLHHIVDHHVNKKDIARIRVENLREKFRHVHLGSTNNCSNVTVSAFRQVMVRL